MAGRAGHVPVARAHPEDVRLVAGVAYDEVGVAELSAPERLIGDVECSDASAQGLDARALTAL